MFSQPLEFDHNLLAAWGGRHVFAVSGVLFLEQVGAVQFRSSSDAVTLCAVHCAYVAQS